MKKALTGLRYVASVFERLIVDGIAGADEHSDSEKSEIESSEEEQMEFPDDVDEATLTRSERIKLKN